MMSDYELECDVLSGAVVGGDHDGNNESFVPIAALPPDAFHHPANQRIFVDMLRQFDRGEVICCQSLRGRHEEIGVSAGDLERIWGWVTHGVADRPAIQRFVKRLMELRAKRIVAQMSESLNDPNASLTEVQARISGLVEIADTASPSIEVRDGVQLAAALHKLLDEPDTLPPPVPTGIAPLDALLGGGMGRGHLVVVGAATGGGKTLFMTNVAANALESGLVVLYASQELTENDMLRRLTGVLSRSVVAYGVPVHQRAREVKGFLKSCGQRFRMESNRMNVAQLAQAARIHARSNGRIDIVVVDHIQITPSDTTQPTRQRELAHVAERLSALAKELDCPILTGSQLTNSKDDVAMSDNTRESKDIAHNARLILEMKWVKDAPGMLDIRIDKNTMGASGDSVRCRLEAGLVLTPADTGGYEPQDRRSTATRQRQFSQ